MGRRRGSSWAKFSGAAYMFGMTKNHRLIDAPATIDALRLAYPGIPELAWRIILGYTPKHTTPAAWASVRPFTIATAAAMLPNTHAVTRRLMSMTGMFHEWLWTTTGTPLTVSHVYTQRNIDRYLAETLTERSQTHRWSVSRQLVKIGRELADADLIALPAPDGKRRPPFTASQIASMYSWANTLTTGLKRQNAWALLSLAGGAGLTSGEIVKVRVHDVISDNDVTCVNVRGSHPRTVPVRHAWARMLVQSLKGRTDPNDYVFQGYRHGEYEGRAIQSFLTENPAPTRPTPSLLRTGWILHHINNHVPSPVIMHLAAIPDFAVLGRYYEHAIPVRPTDFTALLVHGSQPG